MILGYLESPHGNIGLTDQLTWSAGDPDLARLATMYAPPTALSEADGNPAATLLRRLQGALGGEFTVKEEPPDGQR